MLLAPLSLSSSLPLSLSQPYARTHIYTNTYKHTHNTHRRIDHRKLNQFSALEQFRTGCSRYHVPIFTRIPREWISAPVRKESRGQKSEMREKNRLSAGARRGKEGAKRGTRGKKRESTPFSRISGPEERYAWRRSPRTMEPSAKDQRSRTPGWYAETTRLFRARC